MKFSSLSLLSIYCCLSFPISAASISTDDIYSMDFSHTKAKKNSPVVVPTCTPRYVSSINARHIEGKGIGYGEGYTTIEGFYAYSYSASRFIPYLDLRGHIFDNGKLAANAGLGLRYLYRQKNGQYSRVQGIGAYYDYRQTNHYHFNQVALSYDNLGKHYDWRINGYLPVGRKHSPLYGSSGTGSGSSGNFLSFQGHYLLYAGQASRRREVVLWGANAEIGSVLYRKKAFQCYGAIGPYYFGRENKNAYGGEARLAATLGKYLKLQVNGSYDPVFKWIGQGELSLLYPLGSPKKNSTPNYCSEESVLQRASQRVERNEIIAITHQHITGQGSQYAINPLTGEPYYFVFVNSGGNSDGTFESPYATLAAAQSNSSPGDIIYVYPGNGTYDVMTNPIPELGLQLQDNQRLWGSGIAYTLPIPQGMVTIPSQSAQNPVLTNSASPGANGNAIVTLGNSCEVAGLTMTGSPHTAYAVLGGDPSYGSPSFLGITNAHIHDNTIAYENLLGSSLYLANCQGDLTITNNQLTTSGIRADAIAVATTGNFTVNANVFIDRNVVSSTGFGGIAIDHSASGGHITALIINNQVNQDGGYAIGAGSDIGPGGGSLCVSIQNNQVVGNGIGLFISNSYPSTINIEITGNTILGSGASTGLLAQVQDGAVCLNVQNNTASGNAPNSDYVFEQSVGGTFEVYFNDNSGDLPQYSRNIDPSADPNACACQ